MQKNKQKKILEYSAIFEPAIEGGYNVSFPSFPGCVTFGKTFEDAKKNAREVLELWLEELAATGERIQAVKRHPIIDAIEVFAPAKAKLSYAPHNG